MLRLRTIFLLASVGVLAACQINITSPENGYVKLENGDNCLESSVCENDVVNGTEFSETYTAVANPGYVFTGWKQEDKYLCGGSTAPCALIGVPGSFTDQDITLFIEPVFGLDPDFLGGADAFDYFAANIADQVINSRCTVCHISGGTASASRLIYEPGVDAAAIEHNYNVMAGFVLAAPGRGSLLLSKASGGSAHGGGAQLTTSSSGYQSLNTFVGLLED